MREKIIKENMGLIRTEILSSANVFCEYLLGKYFMYVFDDNTYIEVFYRKSSFSHLTGVATTLNAQDFFDKAKEKKLSSSQFFFDEEKHPYDLAKKKTNRLNEIKKFTNSDLIVVKDISTKTAKFRFGLTDTDLTLCFCENRDKNTKRLIDEFYIPASFRVGDDTISKGSECNFVTHIFMKLHKHSKYSTINYGDRDIINSFPDSMKSRLDISKILSYEKTA